jgi:hypothetical protein
VYIFALGAPLVVQFQVDPAALSDGDSEAKVAQVKLSVSGFNVPIEESPMMPGLYQASIDFNDTNNFPVTPTATQLTFTASDSRTPTAAVRKSLVDITIDGVGPSIHIDAPGNLTMQHGDVTLSVSVSDPSGIKPGSLKANVNGMIFDQWVTAPPNYQLKFDTTKFGYELTQLTINVTASDAIGNVASTSPVVISLDNLPPIISLDPPDIREYRLSGADTICSAPFDPVGDAAASDLETVLVSHHYRALVEDQTNHSPGSSFNYLAGVKTSTVVLYLQPDPSIPLLINTDIDKTTGKPIPGKESCDDINGLDQSGDVNQPIKLQLSAINPGGNTWFPKDSLLYNPPDQLQAPSGCKAGTDGATPPTTICMSSEMSRVVPARVQGKPPAVYAFAPSNDPNAGECNGRSWELGDSRVKAGWLCLAARAEDTIGNVGVSAPLRVCFDDGTHKPCDMSHIPTCTDGCPIG